MIAYLLIRTGAAGPLLWLVNIVIYLIVALILWLLLQWIASEFGVPPRM